MTIEAKIEELTAAVNKLADTFARYAVPVFTTPALSTAALKEVGLENAVKVEEVNNLEKASLAKKAKAEPKKEKPEAVTETAPVVEYSQVRDKVLELIKADPNNRAKVLEALEPFGVDTAKALKPEQYAEALEALNGIEA